MKKFTPAITMRWANGERQVRPTTSLDFARLSLQDQLLFLQQAADELQNEIEATKALEALVSAREGVAPRRA